MTDERPRIEINWVQSVAGALAAVSSAVLLSTFGVAGTLIGAAVGSIAATVAAAVYSYSIRVTRRKVAAAQAVAAARIGLAQARVQEASADVAVGDPAAEVELAEAGEDLHRAQQVLEDAADEEDGGPGWREVVNGLPWKRIGAVASAIFVVAMVSILTFELLTGRAVSTYTGGTDGDRRTSIPGLGNSGPVDRDRGRPDEEPAEAPGEVVPPEEEPLDEPTVTPTEEPTPVETVEPTPTPTTLPSEPPPTTEPSPVP